MRGTLQVRFGGETVGMIEAVDRTGLRFTYAPSWLARAAAFPISLSLPLRAESWFDAAAAWFGNLLPEAGARGAPLRRMCWPGCWPRIGLRKAGNGHARTAAFRAWTA